ncbi:MAG: GDP-L-fucose synthase, partial [Bacteroidota bacterium]
SHTQPMLSHINVGTGTDCTIKELAQTIARVVGFQGQIAWDSSKPDGTLRKLMDSSRIKALGWKSKTSFEQGIAMAYKDYSS